MCSAHIDVIYSMVEILLRKAWAVILRAEIEKETDFLYGSTWLCMVFENPHSNAEEKAVYQGNKPEV